VGTPYRHQGRDKSGCDCIAIPLLIAREIGLDVADFKGYGRLPVSDMLVERCRQHLVEIGRDKFAPGDILLMTWGRDRSRPHHFAVVSRMADDNIGIIHSHSLVGRVVEHILDKKWRARITHAFRIPPSLLTGEGGG